MRTNNYYLAGPMTGMPQFNIPAFDRAATVLRVEFGIGVISPAELDDPEVRAWCLASPDGDPEGVPSGETWGDMLSRDIKIVADLVDGVFVLPYWQESRGACLETYVAALCGKPVYNYRYSVPDSWAPVSKFILRDAWSGVLDRVAQPA